MKRALFASALLGALSVTLHGAATLSPLTGFGGSDGWLAPGEGDGFLDSAHLERGLAYNPVSGNLLLTSRTGGNFVRILNANTGAGIGSLNMTGVSGGTFAINMIGVAADGAIYGGNLTIAANVNFKVYRWADESAAPTVAYDGLTGLVRTGDSFAVIGSGASTRIVSAGSNSTDTSNFAALTTGDGLAFTSVARLSISGTSPISNDYRLGLTFIDPDTIIGTQGENGGRVTSFDGVLEQTIPFGGTERLLDYAVIGGLPVLAVADTANSVVSVYDISTPSAPVLLASGTTTSGPVVINTNAVGSVQWGPVSGDSATLYAMNTNNGIQAFTFTVPEPGTAVLAMFGMSGILRRRR